MQPFAFSFIQAPKPPVPMTCTYSPERQLNVMGDGSPAARDVATLLASGPTQSSAGSKTHDDDTD
ncbi:hypothetical protein AF335_15185 [Streptomyces eurocidicus]|uniref:Putative ATP-grasp target RiPP n=1 Tax=Streptomyces eurocidicus TaxID=66423 RepID=A0A2N8NVR1_STREU|nr:putative ATP-grasp-modified RiPP [Streptomyces eurocidicus]MBB5121357.1 putative ATP-grasp target RiPP [Streptomyces eurocidicus]MBF6055959.1 putative ATP-grasp-modified RiPP [Streptomyces eurocidicus]PNE32870.1 hypothetical protein AF335_15185 [Streptomyces eurocidicus]